MPVRLLSGPLGGSAYPHVSQTDRGLRKRVDEPFQMKRYRFVTNKRLVTLQRVGNPHLFQADPSSVSPNLFYQVGIVGLQPLLWEIGVLILLMEAAGLLTAFLLHWGLSP